ncbi:ABC transporter permease [uncultured Bacteroides sp.]|uniref:ABC transporter permease n=1 Tax=uncultured Bacteroides sp. TaxID=162156 RepID=UPI00272BF5D3|nr:FtsX-like permease family protein [uncultured Bacteroides sp.]
MFGQIIRYLWNCRRHNLWIMIELIVITIVSWMVIDPLFVLNYNRGIPDGYDVDGLYRLQLMRNPEDTVSNPADDYRLIMQKLRNIPSVDAATCVLRGAYPSSPGMNANNIVKDTVAITTTYIPFFRGSDFFRTWRFRSASDGTWETLENLEVPDDGIILSEDAAAVLSGGGDMVGQTVHEGNGDGPSYRVVALMRPFKMRNGMQPCAVRLVPIIGEMPEWGFNGMRIFIRAKEGISEERFVEQFLQWSDENLTGGSLVFKDFLPFHEIQAASDLEKGVTNEIRSKYLLAVFFLFNLLLAVSGTFWMNTSGRHEEIGIRLSYGASPGKIRLMLFGEGIALTTVAVLLGCFVYFQWAYFEGLYAFGDLYSYEKRMVVTSDSYLPGHFGLHFMIVSLLVYLLMMLVTCLGISVPAYRISTISLVRALKDE